MLNRLAGLLGVALIVVALDKMLAGWALILVAAPFLLFSALFGDWIDD